MAATTWSPVTQLERRQWLLTNGEVVTEPDLEESPSGRKVRVVGTDLTAYASSLDDLLTQAARHVAKAKGTDVWMPLHRRADMEAQALGFDPAITKAQLHLIHSPGVRYGQTVCWWRFKHPKLPIEAVLVVRMEAGYSGQQAIVGRLVYPDTRPYRHGPTPTLTADASEGFGTLESTMRDQESLMRFREFRRDNPTTNAVPSDVLGEWSHDGERVAAQMLLKRIRRADSIQEVDIPDLREDKPDWLTLELIDTNVNQALIQDLVDYLDGTPNIDEALRTYKELQLIMRKLGVVMEDRTDNDFQAALLAGNKESLEVTLNRPAEVGHDIDRFHSLSMHLPTGTFVVHCNHRNNDNEVAEKWEEALLIAQLSGNEDALLAYALKYAEDREKKRVRKIVKERSPDKET